VRCATLGFELYPFQGAKQKMRNFKTRASGSKTDNALTLIDLLLRGSLLNQINGSESLKCVSVCVSDQPARAFHIVKSAVL
jgi:hypothetical protein